MLTAFGKELRKLRINKGEILKNMADHLGMTSSYLSAIECGKRNIPPSLIGDLKEVYKLSDKEEAALEIARQESLKTIELQVDGLSHEKHELVLKFARTFDSIDDETARRIRNLLSKGGRKST
ncbi:MAG: helix-turn-helix transcriptional regulator [Spirochaetales bacterium]|nr:helix-turn-helix transcriptional regulator [Spirochaetales bacterium]